MTRLGTGITNQQAKYLAALCREMKIDYPGRGMTRDEASTVISTLERRVKQKRAATRAKFEA